MFFSNLITLSPSILGWSHSIYLQVWTMFPIMKNWSVPKLHYGEIILALFRVPLFLSVSEYFEAAWHHGLCLDEFRIERGSSSDYRKARKAIFFLSLKKTHSMPEKEWEQYHVLYICRCTLTLYSYITNIFMHHTWPVSV